MSAIENVVEKEFGFIPKNSILKKYPSHSWTKFLTTNNLDTSARGLYSPRTMIAYTNNDHELQPLIDVHEYFGHGNFCENSKFGRALTLAESLGTNTMNDDSFGQIRILSEAFAIWTENFVTERLDNDDLKRKFDESLNDYSLHSRFAYLFAKSAEQYGDLYFKKEFGFPKVPLVHETKMMLNHMYDTKELRLAILYGSKNPESDVDLFIVSDTIKTQRTHWLDVYALSNEEFDKRLENLMIDVTDPLFTGEILFGEKEVEIAKNKALNISITDKMIDENLYAAHQEKTLINKGVLYGKDLDVAEGYAKSFEANAMNLVRGNKMLTKYGGMRSA